VLKQAFQDLAARNPSNENAIDKRTFLRVFTLPGMLGERLFAVFDRKKREMLDFNDLLAGLALIVRGTMDEKISFLFAMYDFNGTGTIEKIELTTMLNSAVFAAHSILEVNSFLALGPQRIRASTTGQKNLQPHGSGFEDENPFLSEELKNKVDNMVKTAFQDLAPGRNSLNHEEFKKWVMKHPENLEVIESVFKKNNVAIEELDPEQNEIEFLRSGRLSTVEKNPNSNQTESKDDEQVKQTAAEKTLNSSFRSKSQFKPDLSNLQGRSVRGYSITRKLDARRSSSADTRKKFLDDVLSGPSLNIESPTAGSKSEMNRSFGAKKTIVC
jgi:Ca2+-binding EF-hand superfamily protein